MHSGSTARQQQQALGLKICKLNIYLNSSRNLTAQKEYLLESIVRSAKYSYARLRAHYFRAWDRFEAHLLYDSSLNLPRYARAFPTKFCYEIDRPMNIRRCAPQFCVGLRKKLTEDFVLKAGYIYCFDRTLHGWMDNELLNGWMDAAAWCQWMGRKEKNRVKN